jgi:hypothetical protein
MDSSKLTAGQRAYEEKRAAKAGMKLDAWLREKDRRAKAEAEEAAKALRAETPPEAAAKKAGFFARLMERAQKPI